MKKNLLRALVTGALVLAAMPASAATLFTVTGIPGTGPGYTFSFTLADAAAPNFVSSDSTRFNGTPITYTRPGGTTPFVENGAFDGPTFFTSGNQGGIAFLRLDQEPQPQFRLFGTQLFTGTTSAPVFTLGTFDLSSTPRNSGDPVQPLTYRITISDTAAVPEPATWAMMIAGFGMTGAALRRRVRPARVAQV